MNFFLLSVIAFTALASHFATAQYSNSRGSGRSLTENSIPDSCRRRLQSNFFQTGGQSSYGCVLHEPAQNSRTRVTDFCMTCRFPYFYTSDQVKDQIRTSAVDALRLERNRFNSDSSLTFVVNGTDDIYDFMSIFARDARNRDIYNSLDNVFYFFRNGSIGQATYNNGQQTSDVDCETCRTISGKNLRIFSFISAFAFKESFLYVTQGVTWLICHARAQTASTDAVAMAHVFCIIPTDRSRRPRAACRRTIAANLVALTSV